MAIPKLISRRRIVVTWIETESPTRPIPAHSITNTWIQPFFISRQLKTRQHFSSTDFIQFLLRWRCKHWHKQLDRPQRNMKWVLSDRLGSSMMMDGQRKSIRPNSLDEKCDYNGLKWCHLKLFRCRYKARNRWNRARHRFHSQLHSF